MPLFPARRCIELFFSRLNAIWTRRRDSERLPSSTNKFSGNALHNLRISRFCHLSGTVIVDNLTDLRHALLASDGCDDGFRFKRCVKNLS
jgi:hypothetical protein